VPLSLRLGLPGARPHDAAASRCTDAPQKLQGHVRTPLRPLSPPASRANDMASIHDEHPGSHAHRPATALGSACEGLPRRCDELERVLAVARVGFCRLETQTLTPSANAPFKAEFGWPPDAEFTWEQLQQRVHREDREQLRAAVAAAIESGADLALTVRAQWPDGSSQSVALRGRALRNDSGAPDRLLITSRNATAEDVAIQAERREQAIAVDHERRLRQAAEAANRAKDEFLSVISHELRSPLNAILGWNRILLLKRRDDPEVASIAPRIEQSAKSQLKIVSDLLDLGRIGTGKLRIEPRSLRLAPVVVAAVDLARPAAARKGVEIVTELATELGQTRADPDRLQQVVANLLSNAIKFTPSGGRIRVAVSGAAGYNQITVSDTGQGMAPELLPHIFDRFRQGDSSSTRNTGGLGLGLTLVREIVSLHGGTVAASSDGLGRGATFTVGLPAAQRWAGGNGGNGSSPGDMRSGGASTPTLGGLSILVVDDELDARTIVAETLRLAGAEVTVSDSAARAYQHLQAAGAHFDIVVTDIGMPDEDGYSLVRKLRTLQNGRHTLAIAVTGYVSKSDVAAAMDAGFDLHIAKPVDFDAFVPMVLRLAAGARVKGTGSRA
jgi:signal transduction histidine kinase/ActR/RegA family two-component response regulator